MENKLEGDKIQSLCAGEEVEVLDMYMMEVYKVKIENFATYEDHLHAIISKDGKFSLGQITNGCDENGIYYSQIRATSWHQTEDDLKRYWKKESEIHVHG